MPEEQCNPSQRFLFAALYFSNNAIAIWQRECIKRCKEREKRIAYEKFINWTPKENEIAVFTMYAYADFNIPKKFDTIFYLDNPKIFTRIDFELTQCILEAWFPMNAVEHGHKHLCIFSFEKKLPAILGALHKHDQKIYTSQKGPEILGFCHSRDFDAITIELKKKLELKKLYGGWAIRS